MIQEYSSESSSFRVSPTTALTAAIFAGALLPYAFQPRIPDSDMVLEFKTASNTNIKFLSEFTPSNSIAYALRRLVDYFTEDEVEIPAEFALTTRDRFFEMYERF
ncbi:MAG: hypothetical protein DMF63_17605 [Acidobacteria bacterium]|nr:MAG: hypothetical protein DMF63_17605 [Acidobacteriota bacterium]